MKAVTLNRLLAALAVALLAGSPAAQAQDKPTDKPTMKYVGVAARDVARSIKEGTGWCVVSGREKVVLLEGEPAVDCVRYRVVTKYVTSKIPGENGTPEDVVEVTLGPPTDWIAVEFKVPTASGPSFTAAKAANEAIAELDQLLPLIEGLVALEENPKLKANAVKGVAALKKQRAALEDLIKKDIAAIGASDK